MKTDTILQILIYTTYLAELIPFILFIFSYKKINTTDIRVFFLYAASFAFFLATSLFFKFYLKDVGHQLIVNRIFLIVEFSFLSVFYFFSLKSSIRNWFFPASVVLFIIYSFKDFLTAKPGEFSFIPLVIECFFFIIVIVFFMYEKVKFNISSPIYYLPGFWISVAFLIYFSGNFFLFLFSKSMYKDPDFKAQYILIYSTVTIIKNAFLSAAIFTNANLTEEKKIKGAIDIDLGAFYPLQKNTNPKPQWSFYRQHPGFRRVQTI